MDFRGARLGTKLGAKVRNTVHTELVDTYTAAGHCIRYVPRREASLGMATLLGITHQSTERRCLQLFFPFHLLEKKNQPFFS